MCIYVIKICIISSVYFSVCILCLLIFKCRRVKMDLKVIVRYLRTIRKLYRFLENLDGRERCMSKKILDNFVNRYIKSLYKTIRGQSSAPTSMKKELVTKINRSIGQDPDSKQLIGVLDIYGFESFKTNKCLTDMRLVIPHQGKMSREGTMLVTDTRKGLVRIARVLRSLGNLVASDSHKTYVLTVGHDITENIVLALVKCLRCEHRVLKKEAAWVLSNIAAGTLAHKHLISSSEVASLLLHLFSAAPFDIRKEVAYALGNLCVTPVEGNGQPNLILDHLISLVRLNIHVMIINLGYNLL